MALGKKKPSNFKILSNWQNLQDQKHENQDDTFQYPVFFQK